MNINSCKIILLTGFLITTGTTLPGDNPEYYGDNPEYYGFYSNSKLSLSERTQFFCLSYNGKSQICKANNIDENVEPQDFGTLLLTTVFGLNNVEIEYNYEHKQTCAYHKFYVSGNNDEENNKISTVFSYVTKEIDAEEKFTNPAVVTKEEIIKQIAKNEKSSASPSVGNNLPIKVTIAITLFGAAYLLYYQFIQCKQEEPVVDTSKEIPTVDGFVLTTV